MPSPPATAIADPPPSPIEAYAQLSAEAGAEPASTKHNVAADSSRSRSGADSWRDPWTRGLMDLSNERQAPEV
ncbi:hypothetical protein ACQPZG_30685 [Streptomyces sp. CA-294286]|uniref:hypothetical protein n=1 Tax=Streptomyces sp. CA-294286 TaxID=3240070 RepID=UPI003D8B56CB